MGGLGSCMRLLHHGPADHRHGQKLKTRGNIRERAPERDCRWPKIGANALGPGGPLRVVHYVAVEETGVSAGLLGARLKTNTGTDPWSFPLLYPPLDCFATVGGPPRPASQA